jgi:hypothetical protein
MRSAKNSALLVVGDARALAAYVFSGGFRRLALRRYRGSDVEKFRKLVGDGSGVEVRPRDWYKP